MLIQPFSVVNVLAWIFALFHSSCRLSCARPFRRGRQDGHFDPGATLVEWRLLQLLSVDALDIFVIDRQPKLDTIQRELEQVIDIGAAADEGAGNTECWTWLPLRELPRRYHNGNRIAPRLCIGVQD